MPRFLAREWSAHRTMLFLFYFSHSCFLLFVVLPIQLARSARPFRKRAPRCLTNRLGRLREPSQLRKLRRLERSNAFSLAELLRVMLGIVERSPKRSGRAGLEPWHPVNRCNHCRGFPIQFREPMNDHADRE